MRYSLDPFKIVWLKQPTPDTNDEFILHLCSIVQMCKDTDVTPEETRKVIVRVDAMCEDFSKWQVQQYKVYAVPDDAEILAESAFRQFIPSFMQGESMLKLWQHLAYEHWSRINKFKKITFERWLKKIAKPQMRWLEHTADVEVVCQREFGDR